MKPINFRKILIVIIPLIGCFSIVGTGFALWVFNDNEGNSNQEANLDILVTANCDTGAFEARSLLTKGNINDANEGYIFPRMLVFNEGHGYKKDLTSGLDFYKLISNDQEQPGFPTYKDQPYLSDIVLISFYRDASISLKDIEATGVKLSLTVDIRITPALANYITIQDSYGASLVNDGNPGNLYTFDFTNEITDNPIIVSGSDILNAGLAPYGKIYPDRNYEKMNYKMQFSSIFRYTNLSKKPTTIEAYNGLQAIKGKGNEVLSFNFKARYI